MPRSDDNASNEKASDWSLMTWEGAERAARRWATLTLEEIVRAQKEMQELAEKLAANPGDSNSLAEELAQQRFCRTSR